MFIHVNRCSLSFSNDLCFSKTRVQPNQVVNHHSPLTIPFLWVDPLSLVCHIPISAQYLPYPNISPRWTEQTLTTISSSSHYNAAVAPQNFVFPSSGFKAAEAVMGEGTKQTTLGRDRKHQGVDSHKKCSIDQDDSRCRNPPSTFNFCRWFSQHAEVPLPVRAYDVKVARQSTMLNHQPPDVSCIGSDTSCPVPWQAQNVLGNGIPQWHFEVLSLFLKIKMKALQMNRSKHFPQGFCIFNIWTINHICTQSHISLS